MRMRMGMGGRRGRRGISLLPALGDKPGGKNLINQLERCGPGGGANYEEARGGREPGPPAAPPHANELIRIGVRVPVPSC